MFAVYEFMGFQFRQFNGSVYAVNVQEMYNRYGYIVCASVLEWLQELNGLISAGSLSIPGSILFDIA